MIHVDDIPSVFSSGRVSRLSPFTLRRAVLLVIFSLMTLTGSAAGADIRTGLHFLSYEELADGRTSLVLDGGRAMPLGGSFDVSFVMMPCGEPLFGPVMHLQLDNGRTVHLSVIHGDGGRPVFAVIDGDVAHVTGLTLDKDRETAVSLTMGKGATVIKAGGRSAEVKAGPDGASEAVVTFGRLKGYSADVLPMTVRDIRVGRDGKAERHWKLARHTGDRCYDELKGAVAVAGNPQWLIDRHLSWTRIISFTASGRTSDWAFDASEAVLHVNMPGKTVRVWRDGTTEETAAAGGFAAANFPGHSVYDPLRRQVMSYSLAGRYAAWLDGGRWSRNEPGDSSAMFYNHGYAYGDGDSVCYFFGGYGHYQYRNNLFRLRGGVIEELEYAPRIPPRFSPAVAAGRGCLYVFGGRGNAQGRQELKSENYCDLWRIDLTTMRARKVWEKETRENDVTLMAPTMYYDAGENALYGVSLDEGGVLWRISAAGPDIERVSLPIADRKRYQKCFMQLFRSDKNRCYFLVIDKQTDGETHEINVYEILLPLLSPVETSQEGHTDVPAFGVMWVTGAVVLCLAAALLLLCRHRRRGRNATAVTETPAVGPVAANEQATDGLAVGDIPQYFRRSDFSISLLGEFQVRDANGTDITSSFTPRLRDLLILLILHSLKNRKGLEQQKIDSVIWPDKDEMSARNNRYVSIRKLKQLLAAVGDVEFVRDGTFMRIEWDGSLRCDYALSLGYISEIAENGLSACDESLLCRTVELLLLGPLMPEISVEWIDAFKADYSYASVNLLLRILHREREAGNWQTALRITDTIFMHDPFNEEALSAKCSILCTDGKRGMAKNVYDQFAREYRESMGEPYDVPFGDICG